MARSALLRVLVLVLALALVTACQRKAPGPAECQTLAYRLFDIQTARDLAVPGVRAKVDEQIRECLVTPYDYELVRCLAAGVRARACEYAFVERRSGGVTRAPRSR